MPPSDFRLPFCTVVQAFSPAKKSRLGIRHAPQRVCRLAFCQCLAPASLSGSLLCLHAFVLKVSLACSYPGRLFQVRVHLTDRVTVGPDQMFLSSQRAYVFKGHTAGWLELPSAASGPKLAVNGLESTKRFASFLILSRFKFLMMMMRLDPHPNISVSCPFMLNGVPVEFDVRLRQDRSIHLTTVWFGSLEPGIQVVNRDWDVKK